MNRNRPVFLLASMLALATSLDPLSAQTTRPGAPAARDLAKYDKNRNGTLEADEIAALQADEAKIARSAVAAGQSTTAEQVVEMSPFEVREEKRGYYGGTTMSGTRLNTKIEDLASSITVVTKEQMADFAMLNMNDIFNYEANTEGTGNYSAITPSASVGAHQPTDLVALNPIGANRIRGIGPANISFGSFESGGRVPVDPINIDAVEIARGPNSNIFGIGNASGTVNMVPASAKLDRNSSQATARTDNWGGYRSTLDLNRVLIRGMLAARGSAVTQHDDYVRRPSGNDTLRLNGMVTYRPFEKTTFRASYSYYNSWGNRPNYTPIRESVSFWKSQGSPTWDPVTQVVHVNGQTIPIAPGANPSAAQNLNSLQRYPNATTAVDIPTQYIDRANGALPRGIQYWTVSRLSTDDTPIGRLPTPSPVTLMVTRPEDYTTGQPLFEGPPPNGSKELIDWSKVNLLNLNTFDDSTKTSFVQLEQVFFKTGRQSLAAQGSWFREDSKRDQRTPVFGNQGGTVFSNYLQVDVDERRLDGTVNPYFRRPYITHFNPRVRDWLPQLRDSYRGQLAYELDLRHEKNWGRWLGLHRALGYYEYKATREVTDTSWYASVADVHPWIPYGYIQSFPTQIGQVNQRFYVGDTAGQNLDYVPVGYSYGTYNLNWWNNATGRWVAESTLLGDRANWDGSIRATRSILKARGITIQSSFLKDRVITTFGSRMDYTYQMSRPSGVLLPDGINHNFALLDFWPNPWNPNSGPTRTAGIVVKPFRWLSFHANKSDNFVPANVAYNINAKILPNPVGSGNDYGFTLNLFDGKVVLKANQYTTKVAGARTGGFATNYFDTVIAKTREVNVPWSLGTQAAIWLTEAAAAKGTTLTPDQLSEQIRVLSGETTEWWDTMGKTYYAGQTPPFAVQDTNDLVAKGKEIELNYNPNLYWTTKVNVTEQETINQHLSGLVYDKIQKMLPTWQSIIDPRTGQKWYTTDYLSVDGFSHNSPENWVNNRMLAGLKLARALEGKSNTQVRKYRANLSTSYRLAGITDQSLLKRFTVGGAVRWEDKASIGFYGVQKLPAQITELDANNPIWSKSNYYVDLFSGYRTRLFNDKIGATFQVNVRNVQEGGRLQTIKADPAGRPSVFRIIDPRQFIFSVTFDL